MKTRNVIFYGSIAIIIILVLFNLRLNYLHSGLKLACTEDYSSFEKTNICPCSAPQNNVPTYKQPQFNWSGLSK